MDGYDIQDDSDLISVKELCRRLSVGKTLAYNIIGTHGVKSIKIGRRRLVLSSSVEELVKRALQQGEL